MEKQIIQIYHLKADAKKCTKFLPKLDILETYALKIEIVTLIPIVITPHGAVWLIFPSLVMETKELNHVPLVSIAMAKTVSMFWIKAMIAHTFKRMANVVSLEFAAQLQVNASFNTPLMTEQRFLIMIQLYARAIIQKRSTIKSTACPLESQSQMWQLDIKFQTLVKSRHFKTPLIWQLTPLWISNLNADMQLMDLPIVTNRKETLNIKT